MLCSQTPKEAEATQMGNAPFSSQPIEANQVCINLRSLTHKLFLHNKSEQFATVGNKTMWGGSTIDFCWAYASPLLPLNVLGFSLAFKFTHDYESPFVLDGDSQILSMGPVLCSKTAGDCSTWNLPLFWEAESWHQTLTQVLFLADFTWLWTVATCAGKECSWRRKPDPATFFLKEERALRGARHLLSRLCWNECQECHFNNPLKSLKLIYCEFIAKLNIQGKVPLLHACICNSFTLL